MFKRQILLFVFLSIGPAVADDWVVDRLRGQAEQYDGQQWHALSIGDVISPSHHVRTYYGSRMELVRGDEVIEMAPGTFLAIHEASGRKMTTVEQSLGSVTIEAERQNIEHFAVQTPVLAAVVKGTKFTVTLSGDGSAATVDVDRGVVEVSDTEHDVVADVLPGQSASSGRDVILDVSGPGSDRTSYVVRGVAVSAGQVVEAVGVVPSPMSGAVPETAAPVARPVPEAPATGQRPVPPRPGNGPNDKPAAGPGNAHGGDHAGPGQPGPGKPEKPAKPEQPDKPAKPDTPPKPPKPNKPDRHHDHDDDDEDDDDDD